MKLSLTRLDMTRRGMYQQDIPPGGQGCLPPRRAYGAPLTGQEVAG
jgi:hypothetical protein